MNKKDIINILEKHSDLFPLVGYFDLVAEDILSLQENFWDKNTEELFEDLLAPNFPYIKSWIAYGKLHKAEEWEVPLTVSLEAVFPRRSDYSLKLIEEDVGIFLSNKYGVKIELNTVRQNMKIYYN